jgi:hypothetical protein
MTVLYLEILVPNMAVGLFKFIKEFWLVQNIAVGNKGLTLKTTPTGSQKKRNRGAGKVLQMVEKRKRAGGCKNRVHDGGFLQT